MNHFQPSPNPNPNHDNLNRYETFDFPGFEFGPSDFLVIEDGSEEDLSSQIVASSEYVSSGSNEFCSGTATNVNTEAERGVDGEEGRLKVAFRTQSEMEVMDDGFKWRKYGKKMVKTSPNPRNYYKCSSGGCKVKKRVERDSEDLSYVITTYDGVHNHQTPSLPYYNYDHRHTLLMPPLHLNSNQLTKIEFNVSPQMLQPEKKY